MSETTRMPSTIRHGSNIGQPMTRREGILKVTGKATYAADNNPPGLLHAVCAVSTISRGRVTALDIAAAKAHPGVVEVMTPANRPAVAHDPDEKSGMFDFKLDLLQSDHVRYANQPIAVVIAETLEAAMEGAALLAPRYEVETPSIGLDAGESYVPPMVGVGLPSETSHGDIDAGLAAAAHRVEATYETPAQYHNQMEPHAVVAVWDGDNLRVDTPSQGLGIMQDRIARLLDMSPDQDPHPLAPSSAAVSAARASSPAPSCSASSPPAWSAAR